MMVGIGSIVSQVCRPSILFIYLFIAKLARFVFITINVGDKF